jgi:hypothetical protein
MPKSIPSPTWPGLPDPQLLDAPLKQRDDHLRVVAAPGRRVKATRVPLCELHPSRLNSSGINSHHSSGRYRFKKEIAESDLPPAPPEKETP